MKRTLSPLTAISPLDGRYFNQVEQLSNYFSEFALIKTRIMVEVLYLQALAKNNVMRTLTKTELKQLDNLWKNFTLEDAENVKRLEQTTRHDVKAIEYFIKQKIKKTSLQDISEMIHFGLTSEDINNLAWNFLVAKAKQEVIEPRLKNLILTIVQKANDYKTIPMLSRTHGKEAPATTVGKELALFALRLAKKHQTVKQLKLTGKLTGVVGNFHDTSYALPQIDWIEFSNNFVTSLGLEPLLFTTQIEPHDKWAELFHLLSEISTIIESFDQNMWMYISYGYFNLAPKQGQIGSSVMPHKGRNPIGFENSEGNAILATDMFVTLARELPNSRLQRHLSDTTLTRNIGSAFGYLLLAIENANSDISDFTINEVEINSDLENSWGSITSGLQTKLRLLGVEMPYEQVDQLAKSGKITKERLHEFINSLDIDQKEKQKLLKLSPQTFTGKAEELTEMMMEEIQTIIGSPNTSP